MKVNLISSVMGIAALLASPAMATQMPNWQPAPVPSHAYVYVAPHWAPHVAPHGENAGQLARPGIVRHPEDGSHPNHAALSGRGLP